MNFAAAVVVVAVAAAVGDWSVEDFSDVVTAAADVVSYCSNYVMELLLADDIALLSESSFFHESIPKKIYLWKFHFIRVGGLGLDGKAQNFSIKFIDS